MAQRKGNKVFYFEYAGTVKGVSLPPDTPVGDAQEEAKRRFWPEVNKADIKPTKHPRAKTIA